jgi:hypothetical protein
MKEEASTQNLPDSSKTKKENVVTGNQNGKS